MREVEFVVQGGGDKDGGSFRAKNKGSEGGGAEAGGAGLATLLGVTLARVHARDVPMLTALGLLTARPATLLDLPQGRLAKGAPADLVLFHPDRGWKVEAGKLPGKAQNSPFDGRALEGRVLGTWKAGRRVFGG